MTRYVITRGFDENDRHAVVALLREYWASLGVAGEFQNFDTEIADLPGIYVPPEGQMLFLRDPANNVPVGCVALRPVPGVPGMCEMKRLYLRPEARGKGLGRHLAVAAMDEAWHLGYRRMFLDTLPTLVAAQELYRSLGFREAGMAGTEPVVVLFERDLDAP